MDTPDGVKPSFFRLQRNAWSIGYGVVVEAVRVELTRIGRLKVGCPSSVASLPKVVHREEVESSLQPWQGRSLPLTYRCVCSPAVCGRSKRTQRISQAAVFWTALGAGFTARGETFTGLGNRLDPSTTILHYGATLAANSRHCQVLFARFLCSHSIFLITMKIL